ncbi:hypothetical protein ASD11_09470 [Aeromicrobium sp. Root495]|uniref:LysR family transcriptional regulator n=1 Tax=Aeromicrobium sp. Root495 TaxID=1736550 RepID=UPI0006FB15CA|nr:LysR family transcriptional regulator [Aeromicrobium sp. Root495]KQY59757.1 hypothetical protein ASD11_09470 [Aeromicrobium sp. Root495]
MELRTLRYFVAVVETGSVSAAAERVHVTQPVVSRQLQALERRLGVRLFDRDGGRLRLSAAGRELLPRAREVLLGADAVEQAARRLATGHLERVAISAPSTTVIDVLAPFVATLGPDDPLPSLVESRRHTSVEQLQQGADVVVLTTPPPPGVHSVPIATLPLWASVPEDHDWAPRTTLDVVELVSEPVIVLAPEFAARQILDMALGERGLVAGELVEATHPRVAQALAAAGRGVAVVTDDPRFGLVTVPLTSGRQRLSIHLHAAWSPEHHAADALAALSGRLAAFVEQRYGTTPQTAP